MKKLPLILAAAAVLAGCNGKENRSGEAQACPDNAAAPAPPARIVRLDSMAATLTDTTSVPEAFATWMQLTGDADSSPAGFAASRRIAAFLPDVMNKFQRTDTIASELGRVMQATGEQRTVYTIVSPFLQSIVLSGDTAVFVALNHYLGANHPAYNGFPDYVRLTKTPSRIAPDLAEAMIATKSPMVSADDGANALNRMLYDGALVEMVMRATGLSEQQVLGYTDAQMKWATENEARAWQEMLTRRMLFSTDPAVADRLLNPAPSTSVLNPESPGRMGRFIGHRIVASYLARFPEADLMSPDFYNGASTLADAAYQPK